jgi:hypothetical protein
VVVKEFSSPDVKRAAFCQDVYKVAAKLNTKLADNRQHGHLHYKINKDGSRMGLGYVIFRI